MSRPRLPPHNRHSHVPALDTDGFSEDRYDDDSDDEETYFPDDFDFPEDYDEHEPTDIGAIETLLEADDDYEPAPEPGDFWIERDAA